MGNVMGNVKYIFLNVICVLILIYFSFLAWDQMTANARIMNNDNVTFFKSLSDNNPIYKTYHIFSVTSLQKLSDGKVKISGIQIPMTNLNTPLMNFILKGLVNISSNESIFSLIWVLSSLVCAGISMALIMMFFSNSPFYFLKSYFFSPLLLLLWLSWSSINTLNSGQVSYFILPLLCLAFVFTYFKKSEASAVSFGFLAALKVFFLIFLLLFIVKRQWKLLALFSLSAIFFFFLPLVYFSWSDYLNFFNFSQQHLNFISTSLQPMNGSILGVISHYFYLTGQTLNSTKITFLNSILSLTLIIFWCVYDYKYLCFLQKFSDELRFSFLIVILLLCSPLGWSYYFIFLAVPIAVIIKINKNCRLPNSFYIFLILSLLTEYFAWYTGGNYFFQLLSQFAVFLSLILFTICLHLSARSVDFNDMNMRYREHVLIGILIANTFVGIYLLNINYGIESYLTISKQKLIQQAPIQFWVEKDVK